MQEDKHYMAQRIPKQFLESVSEPDKAIAYCIERMHRELADKLLDEVAAKGTCVCSLLPVEKKEVFDFDYNIEFKQGISVRKLVLCKDCKYWHKVDEIDGNAYGECYNPYSPVAPHRFINGYWFCGDGEAKEVE